MSPYTVEIAPSTEQAMEAIRKVLEKNPEGRKLADVIQHLSDFDDEELREAILLMLSEGSIRIDRQRRLIPVAA